MSFFEFGESDDARYITSCQCEIDDHNKPMEDYDIPYIKCALCSNDSLNHSIVYVNESGICSKSGAVITIKSHKNIHLCLMCIDKVK